MKKLISELAQAFLALMALCLLGALVIPWQGASPPPVPLSAPGALPPDPLRTVPAPARGSPEAVVALFGKGNGRGAARAAPPQTGKPMDAPWLVYLGYYDALADGPSYLLKDTRSGRLIAAASRGSAAQEWSVVVVEKNLIIVRNASDSFIVQKR